VQFRTPCGEQEISMGFAAVVLLGSIALWLAEEVSGNQF
jgi:hypothetical protein